MAPASIKAIFPPAKEHYPHPPTGGLASLFKDSFSLPTLLALGGLAQAVLSLVLPARYALLPLLFVLLRTVVVTVRDANSLPAYTARLGVIPGRASGQVPNPSYDPRGPEGKEGEGEGARSATPAFGPAPAEQGVVVLHLGARFNHPLGPLGPGAKQLGDQFEACNRDLLARAREFGCLGMTSYRGDGAEARNTLLSVYYFRDLEGLNRFAHDAVHRRAWDWYHRECLKRGYAHLGIFHEAFVVPAGAYETLYVNMPPTLLAAGQAHIRNEATGEVEHLPTVVDASSSLWRSQYTRMNREIKREHVPE
ncbi:hypothetical protein L209DRAFT_738562 [Thermothelomyces heterothallicus CBS 203.75]